MATKKRRGPVMIDFAKIYGHLMQSSCSDDLVKVMEEFDKKSQELHKIMETRPMPQVIIKRRNGQISTDKGI
jgi:hypothetical protein